MQARRAGRQGRKAEGGLGHWQQFASYVGLFFGPICTTFSTVFFAGSNFWFRVSFMSNKIRALGNSSTSLTLETIFDSSALEISVEILSLLLSRPLLRFAFESVLELSYDYITQHHPLF